MSEPVFLTGGSGFVGRAVIRHFAGKRPVTAMARSESAAQTVTALGATAARCGLDEVAAEHLAGHPVVIHAAARAEGWGPRAAFERVNVDGTRRLLAAAREAGVRRFVHIGTESALFHGQPMRDIDESAPLAPHSPFPYSATKALAEIAVREANAPGFETIVLRPRMIWGPDDTTIKAEVVKAIADGRFMWPGGGEMRTSTCHIDNLVHAIGLAMSAGAAGEAYFITDGEDTSFREFLTAYLAADGIEAPDKSIPIGLLRAIAAIVEPVWNALPGERRPPMTRFEAAIMSVDCTLRIDRARRELGYAPVITRDQGMEQLRRMNAS